DMDRTKRVLTGPNDFNPFDVDEKLILAKIQSMSREEFKKLPLHKKIHLLYTEGTFVVDIRYYTHKVNLYLLDKDFIEVFYNHKLDRIDKIEFLNRHHSRMKFYLDQISLEKAI